MRFILFFIIQCVEIFEYKCYVTDELQKFKILVLVTPSAYDLINNFMYFKKYILVLIGSCCSYEVMGGSPGELSEELVT